MFARDGGRLRPESGDSESPIQMRVNQMRYEAEGILSLELVPVDGGLLPRFQAGAHIDVDVAPEMRRSYSLVNDQKERSRYVIAVNRDRCSRGASRRVHDQLRVGEVLPVSSPRNDFPLNESAACSVFIAGGIGVTPLLCMIRRLHELARPWQLHFAARSPDAAAFRIELARLARDDGARIHWYFGREPEGERLDVAAVTREVGEEAHLYCCGPASLLASFREAAAERAPEQVHLEYFSASKEASREGGFDVVLNRSNKRLHVPPGKSILDVLLEESVGVAFSCMEGVCGTCETAVIEGIPDHRDDFLSDDEKSLNKSMMICCSGSHSSELVLDL